MPYFSFRNGLQENLATVQGQHGHDILHQQAKGDMGSLRLYRGLPPLGIGHPKQDAHQGHTQRS